MSRVSDAPTAAAAVQRVRKVTWAEGLMGAVMVSALVVFFVPVMLLYTLSFGVGAGLRLFDLSGRRTAEPL